MTLANRVIEFGLAWLTPAILRDSIARPRNRPRNQVRQRFPTLDADELVRAGVIAWTRLDDLHKTLPRYSAPQRSDIDLDDLNCAWHR